MFVGRHPKNKIKYRKTKMLGLGSLLFNLLFGHSKLSDGLRLAFKSRKNVCLWRAFADHPGEFVCPNNLVAAPGP